jgi:hypothetical protein
MTALATEAAAVSTRSITDLSPDCSRALLRQRGFADASAARPKQRQSPRAPSPTSARLLAHLTAPARVPQSLLAQYHRPQARLLTHVTAPARVSMCPRSSTTNHRKSTLALSPFSARLLAHVTAPARVSTCLRGSTEAAAVCISTLSPTQPPCSTVGHEARMGFTRSIFLDTIFGAVEPVNTSILELHTLWALAGDVLTF